MKTEINTFGEKELIRRDQIIRPSKWTKTGNEVGWIEVCVKLPHSVVPQFFE